MRQVGSDISATEYWRNRGQAYRAGTEGHYHRHRMSVIRRLLGEMGLRSAVCVDCGCGDGLFSVFLAEQGAWVIGFDPDEDMICVARARLTQGGLDARMIAGGLETLSEVESGSVDHLFALNVCVYFTDQEEGRFYQEAAQLVKRDGSLIAMHSNELFDLYTLNAFTVSFLARHLCGEEQRAAIASLLSRPGEPERVTFNIRDNPLTYRYKLAEYGFQEAQQEFANFHRLPPLLMDPAVLADIDKKEYPDTLDWEPRDRWKLMYMCSMFGSRAVRGN